MHALDNSNRSQLFSSQASSAIDLRRFERSLISTKVACSSSAAMTARESLDGDRLRVVAIRFEGLDGRWLCTALTLI